MKTPPIPLDVMPAPLIDAKQRCLHFHGREFELQQLLDTTDVLPAPLVAVTGAPGAGKTSLLGEFRQNLPAHIGCIDLEPEHFENGDTLLSVIQSQLPELERFKKQIPAMLAALADVTAGTVAKLGGLEMQVDAFTKLLEMRTATSNNPTQPLKLLSQAFVSGYVIALDEAQNLQNYQELPLARAFVHALHYNSRFESPPYGRGWLLLAGLDNTEDVLHQLGRYRISRMFSLAELSLCTAKEILRDHVQATGTDLTAQEHELVEATWIPDLAERYRMWPHHLQGGATALAQVVRYRQINPDGWRTLLFYADQHVSKLYASIFRKVANDGFEQLAKHLAFFAQESHGVLSREVALELANRVPNDSNITDRRRILVCLQQQGFLQEFNTLPEIDVEFSHFRIPIPSFQRWITKNRRLMPDQHELLQDIHRESGGELEMLYSESGNKNQQPGG